MPAEKKLLDGRYELLELIGEGGMGRVYRANQIGTGRPCAIKLMTPGSARSNDDQARFAREARLLGRVNHPNIVQLYDAGVSEDGARYIAMEYVDGEGLDVLLRRESRLPWDQVRHIVGQICDALAAAHRRELIHRDMKPSNCLLLRDRSPGTVKVLDFGIAKIVGDDGLPSLTGESVVGTPGYTAPEQIKGERCDQRTDLWAVGVMLYELLVGKRPFRGSSIEAVSSAILFGRSAPTELVIPTAIWDIVDKALRKDPADRFASAEEFKRALVAAPGDLRVERRKAGDATVRTPRNSLLSGVTAGLSPGDSELSEVDEHHAASAIATPSASTPNEESPTERDEPVSHESTAQPRSGDDEGDSTPARESAAAAAERRVWRGPFALVLVVGLIIVALALAILPPLVFGPPLDETALSAEPMVATRDTRVGASAPNLGATTSGEPPTSDSIDSSTTSGVETALTDATEEKETTKEATTKEASTKDTTTKETTTKEATTNKPTKSKPKPKPRTNNRPLDTCSRIQKSRAVRTCIQDCTGCGSINIAVSEDGQLSTNSIYRDFPTTRRQTLFTCLSNAAAQLAKRRALEPTPRCRLSSPKTE